MARVKRGVTAHRRHKRLLNAAARMHGITYSAFIQGLKKAEIEIDRKVLADLAVFDKAAFGKIAEQAKASLG